MVYICAGMGGFAGQGGKGLFSDPSPMTAMIVPVCEATPQGVRVDHGDWNDQLDLDRLKPQSDGEPLLLIGHSFGGDTVVEIAARHVGDCHLILIDAVHPSAWWSPVQWPWQLSSNVKSATCYMRDGISCLTPPYHSSIVLDRQNFANIHEPNTTHNSIVEAVKYRVVQTVRAMFSRREAA